MPADTMGRINFRFYWIEVANNSFIENFTKLLFVRSIVKAWSIVYIPHDALGVGYVKGASGW